MRRHDSVPVLVLLLLLPLAAAALVAGPARAQTAGGAGGASAEIQIDLPPGTAPSVVVEPWGNHIRLELPRGSSYPLDFAAATGGLISGGRVAQLEGNRVSLDLDLAVGLLDRVTFESDRVVLRIESRVGGRSLGQIAEGDDAPYRLGPDDRIVVTVHGHPELTSTLAVARDGTITAPMVNQVVAAGLTPRELATRLVELLGRAYLVDPQVDVSVSEYRSQWVMVTGEVRAPGRVALRGGTHLKEVLTDASGFTSTAGREILLSHRSDDGSGYEMQRIDRADFETGRSNPLVAHGDIIDVPPLSYCYVQGEVRSPSRVPVERGLTLLRALTMVGGVTEWADLKEVRILYGEGHEPSERVVNLKKIREGRAPDPPLDGGEIIIVSRRFL